jgi:hypothetical protein
MSNPKSPKEEEIHVGGCHAREHCRLAPAPRAPREEEGAGELDVLARACVHRRGVLAAMAQKHQIHESNPKSREEEEEIQARGCHAGDHFCIVPVPGAPREEGAGKPSALTRACVHRRGMPTAMATTM